jgi:protein-L-isoaspartate(D-aspartate) O-methyltransferase
VDAIFVNAGITHPSALWLDRLNDSGRLLYPLTFEAPGFPGGRGCMLLVKRDGDVYSARCVGFAMIYSCTSLREPELNAALTKLISAGKVFSARSLRRDPHAVDARELLAIDFGVRIHELSGSPCCLGVKAHGFYCKTELFTSS